MPHPRVEYIVVTYCGDYLGRRPEYPCLFVARYSQHEIASTSIFTARIAQNHNKHFEPLAT